MQVAAYATNTRSYAKLPPDASVSSGLVDVTLHRKGEPVTVAGLTSPVRIAMTTTLPPSTTARRTTHAPALDDRFAVPLRIGLALSTTPWVQSTIVDKFQKDKKK